MILKKEFRGHLDFIYGSEQAKPVYDDILNRLSDFRRRYPELGKPVKPNERVTEADSILITYGDQIQEPGKPTLPPESETLARAGHVWEIWKVDQAF